MNKIKITPEFMADLKAKAEKATPGPWNVDSLGNIFRTSHDKDEDYQPVVLLTKSSLDEYAPTEADAAYIAAVNPQVVLALIARIEESEKEADWLVARLQERCDAELNCDKCPFRHTRCHNNNWRDAAWKGVEGFDGQN